MTNKAKTEQIAFVHTFQRKTRTPEHWHDKFRICWCFNADSLDYIYEHKDAQFRTNGFVLSKKFVSQLPVEFQKKYFEPNERGLIFAAFFSEIKQFIESDECVSEAEFIDIFGCTPMRYFSDNAFDDYERMIENLL